jgi:hypothetical protein
VSTFWRCDRPGCGKVMDAKPDSRKVRWNSVHRGGLTTTIEMCVDCIRELDNRIIDAEIAFYEAKEKTP